jgi:broad specificity phosphatase PhoE
VRRLVLARHAEAEHNLRNVLNGDVSAPFRLTERGREQARALGRDVGAVDLVAHSSFARTRETGEAAWPGTPLLEVPELNESSFGQFEGMPFGDGYGTWCERAAPDEPCPGGGESRVAAATRYLEGFRRLLARPEDTIALVAHGVHVAYVLLGVEGRPPAAVLSNVPSAIAVVVGRERFEDAVGVLEDWLREPTWA